MMIQPGLATTFNEALVPWKRRIPVQRAGSSGVYRRLWFRQIKENSGRDADATRLQSAMPRSIVACSIAQISNGDRETMLLLVVHPGRSTLLHNERGKEHS